MKDLIPNHSHVKEAIIKFNKMASECTKKEHAEVALRLGNQIVKYDCKLNGVMDTHSFMTFLFTYAKLEAKFRQ